MGKRQIRVVIATIVGGLLLSACQEPGKILFAGEGAVAEMPPAKPSPLGSYLAARVAQAEADTVSAASLWADALAGDPTSPELLRRTLAAFLVDGRVDEAIKLAERLAEVEIDAQSAGLTLAVADVRDRRYESAYRRLQAMPRSGFNALLVPLLQAWTEVGMGDIAAATESMTPLSANQAFAPIYDFHVALMTDLVGLEPSAAESYRNATASPHSASLRVVQAAGAFYERAGRIEEARALYDSYQRNNPETIFLDNAERRLADGQRSPSPVADARAGFAEALFGIASALYQENAHEVALTYAQLALYLSPNLDVAHMLVGDIHAAAGRDALAVASYGKVAADSPISWPARLRLASGYERLDDVDQSVLRLDAMAAERPDRADALVSLGEVLRMRERYEEAAAAYDQALARIDRLEPRHWTLLYARGMSRERIGQWPKAEADFLKALDLMPDQPLVLNYLGYSWVEQGVNLDRARAMIERAVAQRPSDGYIVDSLGWVLYRLGDFEGAVEHLERATELRPHDPIIIDHFGDALWQVGRHKEARFQWQRALSFDPDEELLSTIKDKMRAGLPEPDSEQERAPVVTTNEL